MAVCKGCGKKIYWGVTESGTKVPLDALAPVFSRSDGDHPDDGMKIYRQSGGYVSHFATCPKASQFSGKNKTP